MLLGTLATPPQTIGVKSSQNYEHDTASIRFRLDIFSQTSTLRQPLSIDPKEPEPSTPTKSKYSFRPGVETPPSTPSGNPTPSSRGFPVNRPQSFLNSASGQLLARHDLHPRFATEYTICNELGVGGFGFVVQARRNCDGLLVAVKFIARAKIPPQGWVHVKSSTTCPRPDRLIPLEAYILRQVRHDGVVRFVDLIETFEYFYLVRFWSF